MNQRPQTGLTGERSFVVETQNTIDFATDGMPAVLSTPNLIGWIERTARETVAPFLDPDERTVGIEIDLRHLAPTGLGQTVTCLARVIAVEGRQITFQIEARDPNERIARGTHRRAVVRVDAFARRLREKPA